MLFRKHKLNPSLVNDKKEKTMYYVVEYVPTIIEK